MSYILDALKKSESERARQAGPALMEVRIAPPRSRLPVWAMIVGGLLLLNIVVLAAVLLYREHGAPATAQPAAVAPASVPAAAPVIVPVVVAPRAASPLPATVPLADASPSLESDANPADYAPALPPGSLPLQSREAPEETNLPSRDDLVAGGTQLPELRLSLHVYDPQPAQRYVLINSTRLRQGESMQDGMRVDRITENGVVLSYRGQRFTLQRGE